MLDDAGILKKCHAGPVLIGRDLLYVNVTNQWLHPLRFQQSDEIARRDLPKALEALGLLGRQLNIFLYSFHAPNPPKSRVPQVSLQNSISSNFHYDMFMVPIPSLMLFPPPLMVHIHILMWFHLHPPYGILARFMCPQEAWLAAAWKSVTQRKNRLEKSMDIL